MTIIEGAVSTEVPTYEPLQTVSGPLRAWGDPAFQTLWDSWSSAFVQVHPKVEPSDFLRGTSTAVGALYTDTADIGLFGREIRKLERTSWKRVFSHEPQGFTIATGAFDTFAKTVAVAFLVNRQNPLEGITFQQLDAIYSAGRRRGGHEQITRWGQLGLDGDWACRPIEIFGLDPDTGTAQHVRLRVLDDGPWSTAAVLPPGAPSRMYAGSGGHAAEALCAALAERPGAIGIAGFRNIDDNIKALAVSETEGPPVEGTRETTRSREYPLSRNVYAFVRDAPDTTWNPVVREFLRFILSRDGQGIVDQEGDYLPLPAAYISAEIERLMGMSSRT